MKSRLANLSCCMAVTILASSAAAQEATERFIPIGMSPGVSSVIGTISQVDYDAQRMTINVDGTSLTIELAARTHYYLDNYKLKKSNETGDLHDCKAGLRVEVKLDDDCKADWIKIEETG